MRFVERSIIWRALHHPGIEHCRLWRHDDGWSLDGTVVTLLDDRPTTVRYEVTCDRAWMTRGVVIRIARGSDTTTLQLHADHEHRWWHGQTELEHLHGLLDVDLGVTPATNTLPVRRLRLAPGESHAVTAVWVSFPALEVRRLEQTYTRTDEHHYRYESANGFTIVIEVDDLGVVREYPGFWETVGWE